MSNTPPHNAIVLNILPWVFVPLWSTGFIIAKYGTDGGDPLTFLCIRYILTLVCLGGFCWWAGAAWPKSRSTILHAMISGIFLHGLYLGATWWSVSRGMSPGISALISGLQPIIVSIFAVSFLGESLTRSQKLGIVLGFIGVVIVIAPKLIGFTMGEQTPLLIGVGLLAMAGITTGTLWQKAFIPNTDLRTLAFLQYLGALIVTSPIALLTENGRFDMNLTTILAMFWAVVGLSIGAISLLLYMIRHGAVSRVSAMLYLVPPTTALMSYFLFGDSLSMVQIGGMVITAAGVGLATGAFRKT